MNIKTIRISKNMSQSDLADKLDVSRSTIAMWETHRSAPRASMLIKLSDVLEVSIDDLFKSTVKIE